MKIRSIVKKNEVSRSKMMRKSENERERIRRYAYTIVHPYICTKKRTYVRQYRRKD